MQLPDGFIPHDGGECPVQPFVTTLAIYRREPARAVNLFAPGMERWDWAEGDESALDIIAYRPEPTP